MGNNEVRDREKMRREIVGKFFFDLAKTTYTVVVLGNLAPLFGLAGEFSWLNVLLLLVGSIVTWIFAFIGNRVIYKW